MDSIDKDQIKHFLKRGGENSRKPLTRSTIQTRMRISIVEKIFWVCMEGQSEAMMMPTILAIEIFIIRV